MLGRQHPERGSLPPRRAPPRARRSGPSADHRALPPSIRTYRKLQPGGSPRTASFWHLRRRLPTIDCAARPDPALRQIRYPNSGQLPKNNAGRHRWKGELWSPKNLGQFHITGGQSAPPLFSVGKGCEILRDATAQRLQAPRETQARHPPPKSLRGVPI